MAMEYYGYISCNDNQTIMRARNAGMEEPPEHPRNGREILQAAIAYLKGGPRDNEWAALHALYAKAEELARSKTVQGV